MNLITKAFISFLIGIIGGILFVYMGIGVSMMLPIMLFFNIVKDYKTGIASVLLASASPISIFPIYNYYKQGDIDLVVGGFGFIGMMVGSYITSKYYLNSIEVEILYMLFGIYSVIKGLIFIKKSKYLI
jgi:uncharacterized membrane protein YfcA